MKYETNKLGIKLLIKELRRHLIYSFLSLTIFILQGLSLKFKHMFEATNTTLRF